MANLDQTQFFKDIDRSDMLKHINELPDQIEQAWKELEKFIIPTTYIKVKNIVILGMGGSGIGGSLIQALAKVDCKLPIEVVKDYTLPNYVSSETLVIGVSYSGNTEEPVTAFNEAGKRQAKLIAITIDGDLASLASRFKAPVYRINYGSPPRAALGYTFMAVVAIFHKLGYIELGRDEINEILVLMKGMRTRFAPDVPSYQNDAKKLAHRIENLTPVIIGSGNLTPVAYRWSTQINENAKHFAVFKEMPELCHNWLLSLTYPEEFLKSIIVLTLQSKFDHPRNRLRQNVLSQILHKKGISNELVFVNPTSSALSEQLLTIYLGDFVSYYLAILHDVDPTPMPEVDYLKQMLEKSK